MIPLKSTSLTRELTSDSSQTHVFAFEPIKKKYSFFGSWAFVKKTVNRFNSFSPTIILDLGLMKKRRKWEVIHQAKSLLKKIRRPELMILPTTKNRNLFNILLTWKAIGIKGWTQLAEDNSLLFWLITLDTELRVMVKMPKTLLGSLYFNDPQLWKWLMSLRSNDEVDSKRNKSEVNVTYLSKFKLQSLVKLERFGAFSMNK